MAMNRPAKFGGEWSLRSGTMDLARMSLSLLQGRDVNRSWKDDEENKLKGRGRTVRGQSGLGVAN